MKIYIAGPMSGYKEHNFPAFHAEAARLRELGHEVVNPAEIHPSAANLVFATMAEYMEHWNNCMRADLTALLTCDTVAMMDGWTASRGARLEHHVALQLGMKPRLAAFFVDPVGTCTRCGGGHRLSQCEWPLVAGAHPAITELSA